MTSLKIDKRLLIITVTIIIGLSDAVLAQGTEQKIDNLAMELTQWLYGQEITNPEIKKSNPLTRGIYFFGGASELEGMDFSIPVIQAIENKVQYRNEYADLISNKLLAMI